MKRLLDSAADIALLHVLVKGGRRWHGPELVRDAAAWLGQPLHHAGLWSTVRGLADAGHLERRTRAVGAGMECRLAEGVNVKLLTGGIDPARISREEVLELDSTADKRRVEYRPRAFLEARSPDRQVELAIKQCPSIWDLGHRMTLIKSKA